MHQAFSQLTAERFKQSLLKPEVKLTMSTAEVSCVFLLAILDHRRFSLGMKHRMIWLYLSNFEPSLKELMLAPVENTKPVCSTTIDMALREAMLMLAKKRQEQFSADFLAALLESYATGNFLPLGSTLGNKSGAELVHILIIIKALPNIEEEARVALVSLIQKYNAIFSALVPRQQVMQEAKGGELKKSPTLSVKTEDAFLGHYARLFTTLIQAKNSNVLYRCEVALAEFAKGGQGLSVDSAAEAKQELMAIASDTNDEQNLNETQSSLDANFVSFVDQASHLLGKMNARDEIKQQETLIKEIETFSIELKTMRKSFLLFHTKSKQQNAKGLDVSSKNKDLKRLANVENQKNLLNNVDMSIRAALLCRDENRVEIAAFQLVLDQQKQKVEALLAPASPAVGFPVGGQEGEAKKKVASNDVLLLVKDFQRLTREAGGQGHFSASDLTLILNKLGISEPEKFSSQEAFYKVVNSGFKRLFKSKEKAVFIFFLAIIYQINAFA